MSAQVGILVVGDAMIDQHFTIDALSRHDEKFTVLGSTRELGGTGANTALALAGLGFPVRLEANIGTDRLGDELMSRLITAGITTAGLRLVPGRCGQAVIIHSGPDRCVYVDRGVVDHPIMDLPTADLVYISTPAAVSHCPSLSGRVVVGLEHQMVDESLQPLLRQATLVITNAAGWSRLSSSGLDLPPTVIETRSSDGAAIHHNSQIELVPTNPIPSQDATGAGDAFAAGVVAALATGHPIRAAVERGCLLAGYAVTQPGSALHAIPRTIVTRITTV